MPQNNENYHAQIPSSPPRFQSNKRRWGKRLDQVIWNFLSYCTERKAVYWLFQPCQRLNIAKFLEKYKNRVACQDFISATGDYFSSEFVMSKIERVISHCHFKWRNNSCSYNWTRSTICHSSWPRHLRTLLSLYEGCRTGKSRCTRFKKCYLWFFLKSKFRKSPIENSFSCIWWSFSEQWDEVRLDIPT